MATKRPDAKTLLPATARSLLSKTKDAQAAWPDVEITLEEAPATSRRGAKKAPPPSERMSLPGIEVKDEWLEPPSSRGAKKKKPPPLPAVRREVSSPGIEVKDEWLEPPSSRRGKKKPPPLPATAKAPPPGPREEPPRSKRRA